MHLKEVATKPKPVDIPVVEFEKDMEVFDCSPEEQYVLEQLQTQTKISDKNALATILVISNKNPFSFQHL